MQWWPVYKLYREEWPEMGALKGKDKILSELFKCEFAKILTHEFLYMPGCICYKMIIIPYRNISWWK